MTRTLRNAVTAQDHAQGPADAPVTLVEYGDYECPHCRRAYPIVQEVQRRLGDRLRFVWRHFPLTEIHPHALHAAEAAESVGEQQGEPGYWRMHDAMFAHQGDSRAALDDAHLVRYAADVGADADRVQRELADDAHVARIEADFTGGVRSGVNGTPTFFVNGVRHDGDWTDVDDFVAWLERAAEAR